MSRRIILPTFALAAAALSTALVAPPARAENILDVGAEGSTAFPVGSSVSQAGNAALGWQLAVSRPVWGNLVAGLVGGRQSQDFHATDVPDANLTTTFFGARVQYLLGRDDWDAKLFVATDIAWAKLKFRGDEATFNPPTDSRSSSGMMVVPEAGLWALIPRINAALRFALRVQRVASNETIALGIRRTGGITSLGVGCGVYYRF